MGAIKNSFWYLFFNFSRLIVVFLGTMWISKILGPEKIGEFSYYLSVIIYIGSVEAMCHDGIVKQYLSTNRNLGTVIGTASVINLIISIFSIVVIIGFGFLYIQDDWRLLTFLMFIPGQLNKPLNPIASLFDTKLMSKYSSMALFLGALVSIIFRVLSLKIDTALIYQSMGYSLQTIVYGISLFILYKYKLHIISWKFSFSLLKEIFKKSFPIFLSSIVFLSLSVSDVFMIRHMLDLKEVGVYSIVVKLCEPWVIVSTALCTSYFPIIFSKGENLVKQRKIFIFANQISFLFVFLLGIVLSICIDLLVSILLGDKYYEVGGIFRIYFWSILFLFFANIQHIWEVFNGKYTFTLYKASAAFVLKLILNYILGGRYGLQGFAAATLISFFFYGMGFNIFNKMTRQFLVLQLKSLKIYEFRKNYRFVRLKGRLWIKNGF